MPRRLRITPGGLVYHVLNRGNARDEACERWTGELLCLEPAFRDPGQPAKDASEV